MKDFVELLKKLRDKRVRIHFYIPPEAASVTEEGIYSHIGRIEDVDGHILIIDNRGELAERDVGSLKLYVNLDVAVIFAVEEIKEDYWPKEKGENEEGEA